jgi:hypothetical protein
MKKIITLFLFSVLLSSTGSAQIKVFMPVMEVTNVHPDNALSATKLFRSYAEMEGRFTVILPQTGDSLGNSIVKETISHGAVNYLIGELNRLGETVIVSMTLYDLNGGVLWKDMLKANTPDDLDPVMKRFAKVMGTSEAADKSSDIYSVTDYNSQQLKRRQSNINFGLTVGGGFSLAGANLDNKALSGFGLLLSYDMRDLLFEAKGEFYLGDQTTGLFSLDILKPINTQRNAFFYGGGLGISFSNLVIQDRSYNSDAGLMITPQAGYIFNRDGSVNMRLTVKPLIPVYSVNGYTPVGMVCTLSILF